MCGSAHAPGRHTSSACDHPITITLLATLNPKTRNPKPYLPLGPLLATLPMEPCPGPNAGPPFKPNPAGGVLVRRMPFGGRLPPANPKCGPSSSDLRFASLSYNFSTATADQ